MEERLLFYVKDVCTGLDAIKRAPLVEIDTGIRCIRIGDISSNNPFNLWSFTKVLNNDYMNFKLRKGNVLIARTGNTIGVSYFVDKDLEAVHNNGTIKIITKSSLNSKFLYYYLNLESIKKQIYNYAFSSTQPNLRIDDLLRLRVPNFNISIQTRIANILSTYDKLIENNDKRIAILEQEAEELYKEWFVRFRFPGHGKVLLKTTSTGLRIPETFEIKPINSVLGYYIGGGWGNDDFTNEYTVPASVIRGADFPNIINGCYTKFPYRYHKKTNHKSRILKYGDIVFEISGGTAEQPVGRSVYVTKGLIETNNNAICASFCKLLRCNDSIRTEYFYYWLKFLYDTRIIDRYQLQSTGIINFNFEFFLRKGFVMIPPNEVMTSFSNKIADIFNLIDSLGKENYLLSSQRDYLLPRLMSGKLEVK